MDKTVGLASGTGAVIATRRVTSSIALLFARLTAAKTSRKLILRSYGWLLVQFYVFAGYWYYQK